MEVLTLYMFNPSLERPEHITPGLLLGYMYTQTDRQKDRQTDRQTQTHTHTHRYVCVSHTDVLERERGEKEKVCVYTCIHGSPHKL
jgi:hypothetical protein